MKKTQYSLKPWILKLCLFVVILFVFPTAAFAKGESVESAVNQGEVVDHSLVLYGPEVVMNGTINGDLLAVGDKVKINGAVNGDLVVIGNQVALNSPVAGDFYIAGVTLVMGPQASIGQDIYFIGGSLETQAQSKISRDLNILSLESKLSGNVERKVNALVGPLNLIQSLTRYLESKGLLPKSLGGSSGFIPGGLTKHAPLVVGFGLPSINNLLFSPAPATEKLLSTANVNAQQQGIDTARLQAWVIPTLRNLAALLILGLLVVWLLPAQLSWAGEKLRASPWRSLGTGLLVFIVGWILVLLLTVLIIVLAIFFYWVSLPNLGFLVGTLGLGSMGVGISIFWLSIMYFSKIVVATLVGKLLFRRFIPKYANNRILPFLVGVVIYVLLASIPYLGWLIMVIATLLGLGAIWISFVSRKPLVAEEIVSIGPVAESQDVDLVPEG